MEPLPNEIYQDIVDFQSDVNRPIDIATYREFKKDAAWPSALWFLLLFSFIPFIYEKGINFELFSIVDYPY